MRSTHLHKYAILLLVLMAAVLLYPGCSDESPVAPKKPASTKHDPPPQFSQLRFGMSFAEVVALVGQPTSTGGSGITIYIYDIEPDKKIRLGFANDLIYMYVDSDSKEMPINLLPEETDHVAE